MFRYALPGLAAANSRSAHARVEGTLVARRLLGGSLRESIAGDVLGRLGGSTGRAHSVVLRQLAGGAVTRKSGQAARGGREVVWLSVRAELSSRRMRDHSV